jgi:hypothetical protein
MIRINKLEDKAEFFLDRAIHRPDKQCTHKGIHYQKKVINQSTVVPK